MSNGRNCLWSLLVWGFVAACTARGDDIKLITRPHDPYGVPRPGPGQEHVPLSSSFYIELGMSEKGSSDVVLPESVAVELQPEGGEAFALLRPNRQFADGVSGRLMPGKGDGGRGTLAVYLEPAGKLRPSTRYTIRVSAKSRAGAELPAKAGTWTFTTEAEGKKHALEFELDLDGPAVHWQGGFFTGFCSPGFCTSHATRIPTYELMDQVRKTAPRAWSLQRDFWMTGMEHRPQAMMTSNQPNIVRERETRRITAIDKHADGSLLRLEDFFGHEQYGIESNRPLSADYHLGDEVLVADGENYSRAKVVKADDEARTVLVSGLSAPADGWKLAYAGPLPRKEDPNAPGLFPPGGCYLRKFKPCGTPAYYWGRLDFEWDLDHRRFHRRLLPNFADAPGDLSIDGRDWTTAKDYAELHEVARAITTHIIERYGDATLTFPWSVFNEPDLGLLFWHSDWDELQKFYDYTADGVLRAFEDRGYDSKKVFVGGLELGGIFGTNLKLREFLSHCSPREEKVKGALPLNAAFAEQRLDGKRSRRVEELCRANGGRGAPCDFVSVHAYNRSKMMADKLARAKEVALEIDPDYYAKLWVNSHESTPGWEHSPDPAYGDSYLGNGYDATWCVDVACRQLRRAAADPRYGFGESILTFWPWPNQNFGGGNDCVRVLHADDGRTVTIAMPILHFLGLLAQMGPEYHVLTEQTVGGHTVSGFASRDGQALRVLLYSHNMADTQSRSAVSFEVSLRINGLKAEKVAVEEYGFDADNNSYYRLARELRDGPSGAASGRSKAAAFEEALRDLEMERRDAQLAGLKILSDLGPTASDAASAILRLHQRSTDEGVKEAAAATVKRIMTPKRYPAAVIKEVQKLAELRRTAFSTQEVLGGTVVVKAPIAGNGLSVLVLEPATVP
jgi:Glycosyl hydrolases family 39